MVAGFDKGNGKGLARSWALLTNMEDLLFFIQDGLALRFLLLVVWPRALCHVLCCVVLCVVRCIYCIVVPYMHIILYTAWSSQLGQGVRPAGELAISAPPPRPNRPRTNAPLNYLVMDEDVIGQILGSA